MDDAIFEDVEELAAEQLEGIDIIAGMLKLQVLERVSIGNLLKLELLGRELIGNLLKLEVVEG